MNKDKLSWFLAQLEYDGFANATPEQIEEILAGNTAAHDPALVDYLLELEDEYSE